jgi:flagellar biosynthesis GTPase FlhF
LIDTPGLSPADTDEIHAWDRFFRLYPDMERHFVLRADTRSADIYRVMARMEGLHPTHLLFTGLDEVSDYAAVLETAMKSGVALDLAGMARRSRRIWWKSRQHS